MGQYKDVISQSLCAFDLMETSQLEKVLICPNNTLTTSERAIFIWDPGEWPIHIWQQLKNLRLMVRGKIKIVANINQLLIYLYISGKWKHNNFKPF